MKKLYLIVILTSIINISKADWEVFRLNQKSYYTYFSDSTVMSLYMDTIIQRPGYQVYFQNRKYYGYDHGSCYSTLAPPDQPYVNLNSPMSPPFDSLEIKGDSVIYYNFSTPVYFLPNAVIGQSWNFGTHVVTHVSDALRSFLGVTDSVRLFSIGSDTIILSKNYGFVKYPVFYTASSTSVDIEHLIGFSNQSGAYGFIKPGYQDFIPYQPGDILYWKYTDYPPFTWPGVHWEIDTITSVVLNTDSFSLKFNQLWFNNDTSYYYQDAGMVFYDLANQLEAPTNWFSIKQWGTYPDEYIYLSTNYIIESDNSVSYPINNSGHTLSAGCTWGQILDVSDGWSFNTKLGLTVYGSYAFFTSEYRLQGAILGGVVYGDTTNYLGIENPAGFNFEMFPNPVIDKLIIKTKRPVEYTISDLSGREIMQGKTNESYSVIDLSQIGNGIYLIKIDHSAKKFVKMSN